MSDLYLVAHKVRGEPAFDIASRMECPLCRSEGCAECDSLGFWWIIPTSGHRAYPYWWLDMNQVLYTSNRSPSPIWLMPFDFEAPEGLPDHYPLRHTPSAPRVDILALLPQEPKATIRRRL